MEFFYLDKIIAAKAIEADDLFTNLDIILPIPSKSRLVLFDYYIVQVCQRTNTTKGMST